LKRFSRPQVKFLPAVKFLVADSDLCALVVAVPHSDLEVGTKGGSRIDEDRAFGGTSGIADGKSGEGKAVDGDGAGPRGAGSKSPVTLTYSVQLRNSIGCVVDSRTLPFEPLYVSMSDKHFVASNDRTVYVWHFRGGSGSAGVGGGLGGLSATMGRGGMNTAAVSAARGGRQEYEGGDAEGFSAADGVGDGTGSIPTLMLRLSATITHTAVPPHTHLTFSNYTHTYTYYTYTHTRARIGFRTA
jgi:hypothetical protein